MALYFSIESRINRKKEALVRLSWYCCGERIQTTTGLLAGNISGLRARPRHDSNDVKNSKNMTYAEINQLLEKIYRFITSCEEYARSNEVKLTRNIMRGLFLEYKSLNFTCEQEVMDRWITPIQSCGLYWQKYDGGLYKKLCEATDYSDTTRKYVIYQELSGHSKIFSMAKEKFYGSVEFNGECVKCFVEVSAEIAQERDLGE